MNYFILHGVFSLEFLLTKLILKNCTYEQKNVSFVIHQLIQERFCFKFVPYLVRVCCKPRYISDNMQEDP